VRGLYDELHELNMEAAQINAQRDYAGEMGDWRESIGAPGARKVGGAPSWTITKGGMAHRGARAGGKPTGQVAGGGPERDKKPPIPEWMEQYFARDGEEPFIPLGAQTELSVSQLQQMAGYMGYAKAGKPETYSKEYVSQLQNLGNWWEEYRRGSIKGHPSTSYVPKASWRATSQ